MRDIPVVILCGGRGARLGSVTEDIPKPLIPVGDKPILWHVMKIYAFQGFRNFILCLGYKGEKIKSYFEKNNGEKWNIRFVDTGMESMKSERLACIRDFITSEDFFLAYGDDVADIDLHNLLKCHKKKSLIATITVVKMISEFGLVKINQQGIITEFREKPVLNQWMNGGFMALNKKVFDYLKVGEIEKEVFEKLVSEGQIRAYKHHGNWKTMNTLKDNMELNSIWNSGRAFWKQ